MRTIGTSLAAIHAAVVAAAFLPMLSAHGQPVAYNLGTIGAAGNGVNAAGVTIGVPGPLAGGDYATGYFQPPGGNGTLNTQVPYNAALNPSSSSSPFTIEYWVEPAQTTDGVAVGPTPVFNRVSTSPRSGWVFYQRASVGVNNPANTNGSGWNFRMYNGNGSSFDAGLNLTGGTNDANAWSYIVATWNGTTASLYDNGTLVASGTGNYNPSTSAILSIGTYDNGDDAFNGAVGKVAIYGTALSPSRIQAHYAATSGTAYSSLVLQDGALEYLPLSPLVWTGSLNNFWDVNTTANFRESPGRVFNNGDYVTFDNSGSNRSISVDAGGVSPGKVVFATSAGVHYTLNGGPIQGTTTLVTSGAGLTTLNNVSSFTGDITINGGTLEGMAASSGANTPFGLSDATRTITINAGGTMLFDRGNTFGIGSNFYQTNVPTLVINQGGLVTNADPFNTQGVNNALNNVVLNGGTLTATTGEVEPVGPGYAAWNINGVVTSSGNSLITTSEPINGWVMLSSSQHSTTSTFNVTDGTLTVSAPLKSDDADNAVAGLNLIGAGTLLLTTSNTYSLATTISGGTLQLGDGKPGHDGSLNYAGGIENDSALVFNLAGAQTYLGTITGAGAFVKSGTGSLVLSSATTANLSGFNVPVSSSSFSGDITINGGTLTAAAVSASIGTNGVLGQASNARTITVNAGGTLNFLTSNVFGQFYATSVPTLVINGGVVTNTAPPGFPVPVVNNALNNVVLNGGTLTATTGESNASGGYGSWDINGMITSTGNSLISTGDPVYGNVMLSNNGVNAVSTTFNVQSGTLTVSARLFEDSQGGNSSGLNLTGAGTLLMTASNVYSHGTTVSGGTLQLGDGKSGHDGSVSAAGGIVDNSTLVFDPFSSQSYAGAINGSGNLVKSGTGKLVLSGSNTYAGGTTVSQGTLVVASANSIANGTNLTVGTNASAAFGAPVVPGTNSAAVSAVPEPGTLALLVAASVIGFGARRRRKCVSG
jgi:autotransporter-associated beta strand protein